LEFENNIFNNNNINNNHKTLLLEKNLVLIENYLKNIFDNFSLTEIEKEKIILILNK
jgi:hypothetical protein